MPTFSVCEMEYKYAQINNTLEQIDFRIPK